MRQELRDIKQSIKDTISKNAQYPTADNIEDLRIDYNLIKDILVLTELLKEQYDGKDRIINVEQRAKEI